MLSLTDAIVAELRSEMRGAGISYDALSASTKIPRRTLIRHLTGETPITADVIEHVSDALGVPMDEVFARAKMRRFRPLTTPAFVIDEGEDMGPTDTPPASSSPAPLPSPHRAAQPAAEGPADS